MSNKLELTKREKESIKSMVFSNYYCNKNEQGEWTEPYQPFEDWPEDDLFAEASGSAETYIRYIQNLINKKLKRGSHVK